MAAEAAFDFQIIMEGAFLKKTSDLTQTLTSNIIKNY